MKFISEYKNVISDFLCDDIIKLFEKNKNDKSNYFEIPKKNSTWNKIERLLYRELLTKINNFKTTFINNNEEKDNSNILSKLSDNMYLKNFLIQKMNIVDEKIKMNNYNRNNSRYNILTFFFFLNNIENGGDIIVDGFVVKPEKGKLIIFPDDYNYNFILPMSNTQYIISGEISSNIE